MQWWQRKTWPRCCVICRHTPGTYGCVGVAELRRAAEAAPPIAPGPALHRATAVRGWHYANAWVLSHCHLRPMCRRCGTRAAAGGGLVFQASHGLDSDGVVGGAHWRR